MSDHVILAGLAVVQVAGLIILALQLRETRHEIATSLREVRRDSRRMVRALARLMTGRPHGGG